MRFPCTNRNLVSPEKHSVIRYQPACKPGFVGHRLLEADDT
jgi:hypothetical protein